MAATWSWRSALALAVLMSAVALAEARAQQGGMGTTAAAVTYAAQGWSPADRNTFYTTSQGSRMMPYAWFKALRRLDVDQPFAADKLQRYGYLPNDPSPVSNPEGLPVGFVIDGDRGVGIPRHDMRGLSHRTTRVQAGRRDPRSASRRRTCQCGFPGISHRSPCRVARNADAARPARCICPRGCRPRLHGREGDAGQGRVRQMGRAIRRIHGQEPARVAVGAGPARRFRHDLQPRRRARLGRGRQFQDRRRTRQLSVPVERVAAGPHAMERRGAEWALHSRARAQHRRGLWRFRGLCTS